MSDEYKATLHRRIKLNAAGAVVSFALMCLGIAVRLLHPGQSFRYNFAWSMFIVICGSVLLSGCLGRIHRTRKSLRRGLEAEIEETDERTRHIQTLAWAASAKFTYAALFVTMLVSLALVQLTVFWTCYWAIALLALSNQCFLSWYSERL